jgi:hypothetical protein
VSFLQLHKTLVDHTTNILRDFSFEGFLFNPFVHPTDAPCVALLQRVVMALFPCGLSCGRGQYVSKSVVNEA